MSGTLPQKNSHAHVAVKTVFTEDDFNDLEELQSGGEATCYRAISSPNSSRNFGEVCIKRFHSNGLKTGLNKELEVFLKHSDHPNLIRFFGFYENNQRVSQRIGYVMEYMPGGSLDDVIHHSPMQYSFARACNWIAQAGRGLDYLHGAGIIHRDVKPRNMLLDRHREILKLSDFGLAKNIGNDTTFESNAGTYPYMAPEVLDVGDGTNYSFPSDVYSLGITFWELIHRREPYAQKGMAIARKVIEGERPIIDRTIGPNTKSLLQRCWSHAPNNRCKVTEIIEFTNKRGVVDYSAVTNQPPVPVHSRSQPNIPKVPQKEAARAATAPHPVKREKTLWLDGPADNKIIPRHQKTIISQMTHELVAFLFPLCPHKFQSAIQAICVHALEFEQHLLDPVALICNKPFNICCFTTGGQICNAEMTTVATAVVLVDIPQISESCDYIVFNWPRERLFFAVYLTKNVNQCTPVKVDAFKKLLVELEKQYNAYYQQFRTLLSQTRFNCLIVGDWKHAKQFFYHLKSGDLDENDNPMKLYDMNYHFFRVSKKSCLSHAANGIIEKISHIGQVHKIVYLVDTDYDAGQFGHEWEQLFKPINASVCLILSNGNPSNLMQRAELEARHFQNRINFRTANLDLSAAYSNGQDFFTRLSHDLYSIFSCSYADCINKLAFGIEPLKAVAG